MLQEKASCPKEFWSFLKKIGKQTNTDQSNSNAPNPDEWLQHFTSLNALDPSAVKPVKEEVDKLIQEVEDRLSSPQGAPSPLMTEMDSDEIMKGIKALKKGKAVGTDQISNDIIIAVVIIAL